MLKELLKEVVSFVVGKNLEPIAEILTSKNHVNEFLIAKKLGITINQTRNILYRLSDYGLVSSIRKKDKRKGWYTYFWKIENLKALNFLKDIKLKKREQVYNQIKNRETRVFYICKRCNIELNETNALLYDFTCNECGDVFKIKDNTSLLKQLKKNLKKIDEELDEIDTEIEKELSKIEKSKEKELSLKKKTTKKKSVDKKTSAKKKPIKKKTVKKKSTKKKTVSKKKTSKKKSAIKKPNTKKKTIAKKTSAKKKPIKKKTVKKKSTKKSIKNKSK